MSRRILKHRLREGATVLGCWLRYADPTLVEFVGYQGWDFVVLDAEHGTLEPRDCENAVRAAELRDVAPIVRVTTNQPHVILRYLDAGAQGVNVPMVESAADAERAVAAVKYVPRGARGLAASRSASFGHEPFAEYVVRANDESLVAVQVETAAAVEAIDEIVAVPDVDVAFVGLTDLSTSLGVPGETGHPLVEQAVERVLEVVVPSGCALGVLVGSTAAARSWIERGARYVAISLEALIRDGSRDFLEAMRP